MAVRKNILALSAADQERFIAGLKTMKSEGTYDDFIRRHAAATRWTSWSGKVLDSAHKGPAFLPWHRKFLLEFEAGLQDAMGDPDFGLPYYDWTDGLGAKSLVWAENLMGGAGTPVTSGPFQPSDWATIDGNGKPTDGLRRVLGNKEYPSLPRRRDVHRLMYLRRYDVAPFDQRSEGSMRMTLEGFTRPIGLHNLVHMWVGGQMANVPVACNDPIFFLHHCNVDRIWAEWQLVNPHSPYVPREAGPQGHRFEDAMYPWLTKPDIARPSTMQSIANLGYSYDRYYQIKTLQVIITTGSNWLAGTDDEVSFVIRGPEWPGPFWGGFLDASHCDHRNPFERGQTDTFTFTNVGNGDETVHVPLTPAVLDRFTLGKAPNNSLFGTGDWTIAGVKIVADGLVLYNNQKLNQGLNNHHQSLNDGHANALISNP
ncbi:MAG TPA: tyrosinase family protein [Allosphingosinicella sp.]